MKDFNQIVKFYYQIRKWSIDLVRYIDDQIFKFIRLIKPILGTNIWTDFQMRYSNEMPNCVHQFYDIIKGICSEKFHLILLHLGNVSELAIFFNGFNLLNLEFLKTIQFVRLWSGKAINEHILEWMHFPLDENKLRYIFMHIFDINQMAEICKKVNYFLICKVRIALPSNFSIDKTLVQN